MEQIPGDNLKVGKRTVVCCKHFAEEDINWHDDLQVMGGCIRMPRKTPRLKKYAYPVIFPGCPTDMSKKNIVSKENYPPEVFEYELSPDLFIEEETCLTMSSTTIRYCMN